MNREYKQASAVEILKEEKEKSDGDWIIKNIQREIKKDEEAEKFLGKILDKMELAKKFIESFPLYYDYSGMFWRWNNKIFCWEMTDETDILNLINGASETNVINSKEKTEILNALKLEARRNKPMDVPPTWIQFGREIINIETGSRFKASPIYFITNPIPHNLPNNPRDEQNPDTSKFDKLFSEWVAAENINTLYEIIAYSLLPSYPIERIFCLLGAGSNGKSVYRQILRNFIGEKNVCSTSLDLLSHSRFEPTKLYKKLVCEMGETNLSKIENTQIIKRLVSGKDLVGGEIKNKTPFDFLNYAKLVISTNNLPPTEDKTDGFYRKWLIVDFPNRFEKEIDLLGQFEERDYEYLGIKCTGILVELLKNRQFTGEGNIDERKERYEAKSNPFEKFYSEFIDDGDPDADIPSWELEKKLNEWMKENKFRAMSEVAIAKQMKVKGIINRPIRKEWFENNEAITKQIRCWLGIKWK